MSSQSTQSKSTKSKSLLKPSDFMTESKSTKSKSLLKPSDFMTESKSTKSKSTPLKNNVVSVCYNSYGQFRTPYNLKDDKQIKDWWVRWNTLHIEFDDRIEQFEMLFDMSEDYKTPQEEELLDDEDCSFNCNPEDYPPAEPDHIEYKK